MLNELDVIRWNVDKRYLAELERAGVPTVPTRVLEAGEAFQPPGGRFVVKPVVSAGGRRSAAYEASDAPAARAHVAHLQAQGHRVMIQPYLAGVDDRGETALLYLNGGYSHAVRKAALLADGRPPGEELYLEETIEATKATPAERHVAARALAAVPLPASNLLYARVDLVPGRDGEPLLLELELIEPSLYLSYAPGAVARLADGIATRLSSF